MKLFIIGFLLIGMIYAEPQDTTSRCINCVPYQDSLRSNSENNIAVFELDGIDISTEQINTIRGKIQADLIDLKRYTVVEREQLDKIFEEQRLQELSKVSRVITIGHIAGVRFGIMGSAGKMDGEYFYSLKFVNIETGVVSKGKYISVPGSFSNFLNASTYAVKNLLGMAVDNKGVVKVNNPRVTKIYERNEVIRVEQHIYQHKGGEYTPKRTFIPCGFCQGRGKLMDGKDCPYCSGAIKYNGAETHYQAMTGKWVMQ